MITFDQILDATKLELTRHQTLINQLGEVIINRDLNGRVRLILSEQHQSTDTKQLEADLKTALNPQGQNPLSFYTKKH